MSDDPADQTDPALRGVLHPEGIRVLRELAAGFSHEVNNALGVIVGNVHLAERQLPLEHPARKFLAEISKVADEAQQTTRKLAGMARGAGAGMSRPLPFDELLAGLVSQAECSIELEQGALGAEVHGDPFVFEQALSSVLKFLCADRPHAGLTIRTRIIEQRVELAIEDEDGPTPTPKELYNAFAPYQSFSGRGKPGLRLTQLAELAQRFGGRVSADIPTAGGLGLYLSFPLA